MSGLYFSDEPFRDPPAEAGAAKPLLPPEAQKALLAASRVIEREARALNSRRIACCSQCGTSRYEDYDEYKAALEMTALASKVRQLAGRQRKYGRGQ